MEPTLRERIAAEVRAELARKGVKPHKVAALLGQTRASISFKYNGKRDWRPDELIRLAQHLEIPVTRFLPEPTEAAS